MDELIRKQDAIEAINVWLYCDKDERMPADVIKALPPVQSDVPEIYAGELISRQAAIDTLNEQIEQCNKAIGSFDISPKDEYAVKVERASLKAYKEQLENLPTVQPQQMKGRWLPDNNFVYEMRFVCSVCKESEVVPTIGFTKYKPIWDFCPNCGAKMERNDDGTDL